MLDPATWLEQAQELTLGQRRRVPHECGEGKVMLVDHKEQGYSAWCHRCNDKGWHPHPRPSLAERVERLRAGKAEDDAIAADPRPPMPANFDPTTWPLHARVWLYKAGISNDIIVQQGFYYAPRHDRVVLPVLHEGSVVYWQARGFDKGRAKYINPPVDRSTVTPHYTMGDKDALPIVLTEDILSAVRVGMVTASYSLLGTSPSYQLLLLVAASNRRCVVWLDPDAAGRKGATKTSKALRNLGVDTRVLHTEKDPKFYSNEEIRTFLSI